MDIKVKPVRTHNSNGDRFILTIGEDDNSVFYFDNHKRDGYGLYAGDNSQFSDGKISVKNFEELINKLNSLYLENQALKKDSSYHQIVMQKFDEEIEEWEKLWNVAIEKDETMTLPVHRYYMDVINALEDIKQHTFQGEEYE